jgi:hypothetical protein
MGELWPLGLNFDTYKEKNRIPLGEIGRRVKIGSKGRANQSLNW